MILSLSLDVIQERGIDLKLKKKEEMKVEKVEAGIRVLIIDKHLYDSL